MTALEPLDAPQKVKLTVRDFLLLDEAGAFSAYSKAELINGTIYVVNAQHRPHARAKTRLAFSLAEALKAFPALEVLIESAVEIEDSSAPEPDIVVTDEAEGQGLVPLASVKLAIEAADTSLSFDLGEKAALYAAMGIAEYWVVDIRAKLLHQLWSPSCDGYVERRQASLGDPIVSVTLQGLTVDTHDL